VPPAIYEFLTILLLLTIGLKGGVELAAQPFAALLPQMLVVAVAYLAFRQVAFEEHVAVFLVLLEMPAIVVGVLLARGVNRTTRWRPLAHEVLLGKSIVLLVGGLLVGWVAGAEGIRPIAHCSWTCSKASWRCSCLRWD
jgi:hypothetical protein